jgi:hypothetical protein
MMGWLGNVPGTWEEGTWEEGGASRSAAACLHAQGEELPVPRSQRSSTKTPSWSLKRRVFLSSVTLP